MRYEADRIITLFGGMDDRERDEMKAIFNDAAQPVRILIATDAAAEGLNLQRHARYLLHFDCPWNPSRLEQRNGRIDRHGQPRPVTIHHFVSEQIHDLLFLSRLLTKADDIREDLGSTNELFDVAAHRRLVNGESVETVVKELERQVAAARGRAQIEADAAAVPNKEEYDASAQITTLAAELDLNKTTLRDTLETAIAVQGGRPQLRCDAENETCQLLRPDLAGWSDVVDQSLRRPVKGEQRGPVLKLAFGPEPFYAQIGPMRVFHPRPDIQMMHLGHPMMQKAMRVLTRKRFPGSGEGVSRWCIRRGDVPSGADAVLVLSIEEVAVNGLRETFHHWVRSLAFPIQKGKLGKVLPHQAASALRGGTVVNDPAKIEEGRELIEDVLNDLKEWLAGYVQKLESQVQQQLATAGEEAKEKEQKRYQSRIGEVSTLITNTNIKSLEKEIEALRVERQQGLLFQQQERFDQIDKDIELKQQEVERQKRQHEEVKHALDKERERIVNRLLPNRYALAGQVHAFPLTITLHLPQ
jgi:hypothetical protein